MAPITKFFVAALCAVAASPVLSAPIQASTSLSRRQLAGEGSAFDSIFTDTDSGTGYGIEDAEDNAAQLIDNIKGGQAGTGAPAAGPGSKRQLNKVVGGEGNLSQALGVGGPGAVIESEGDDVDGQTTDDAANAGQQIGNDELSIFEGTGSDVPTNV